MASQRNLTISWQGILGVLSVLLAWELLIRSGHQFENLPPPSTILVTWVDLLFQMQYWEEIAHTLLAAILGWFIASLIGIVLGVSLGLSATLFNYSFTSLEVIRPWPGVAFAPIGLILFGFSLQMELVVIVLPTLWPVFMNTLGGINQLSMQLQDVTKSLHMNQRAKIIKVYLPAATASIVVGMRLSLSLAIVMAVVAEMIGNPAGIGYAIIREQQAMQPNKMFAYIFTIAVLNVLANYLLNWLVEKFMPSFRPIKMQREAVGL